MNEMLFYVLMYLFNTLRSEPSTGNIAGHNPLVLAPQTAFWSRSNAQAIAQLALITKPNLLSCLYFNLRSSSPVHTLRLALLNEQSNRCSQNSWNQGLRCRVFWSGFKSKYPASNESTA